MSNQQYTYDISFKIAIALYLPIILYVFSQDAISMNVKLCVILFFYVMLYIDYLNNTPFDKKPIIEKFCSMNSDLNRDLPMTRRQKEIKKLNNNRCTEGRFYVDCHSCGRKRVLDDMLDYNIDIHRQYDRQICMSPCSKGTDKKMSFFNSHYVDSDKIFSYDSNIIDSNEKNKERIQTYGLVDSKSTKAFKQSKLCLNGKDVYEKKYDGTYVYWPTLDNPVNGPPYV